MADRPTPTFSGRQVFNDPNFEGDAFLKGLGDANLSPFKDVAEGLSDGIALANDVSAFIRDVGPEGVERRRLDLETKKSQAESAKNAATLSSVKARVTAATEQEQLLREQTRLRAEELDLQASLEASQAAKQIQTDLAQMGNDPQSLLRYIQTSQSIGVASADENFSQSMGTAIARAMMKADPQTKVELVRAYSVASPQNAKALISLLPTDQQAQFNTPAQRAQINASNARAEASRRKGAKKKGDEEVSEWRKDTMRRMLPELLRSQSLLIKDIDDEGGFSVSGKEADLTEIPIQNFPRGGSEKEREERRKLRRDLELIKAGKHPDYVKGLITPSGSGGNSGGAGGTGSVTIDRGRSSVPSSLNKSFAVISRADKSRETFAGSANDNSMDEYIGRIYQEAEDAYKLDGALDVSRSAQARKAASNISKDLVQKLEEDMGKKMSASQKENVRKKVVAEMDSHIAYTKDNEEKKESSKEKMLDNMGIANMARVAANRARFAGIRNVADLAKRGLGARDEQPSVEFDPNDTTKRSADRSFGFK